MFSHCTSVSSLDSFSTSSIASSVRSSEPCSGVPSGVISPSDLPDSPGQTMPPSRAKTPPLLPQKPEKEAEKLTQKLKEQEEQEESHDVLLHFATESTPHGFSKASSLSALSLDEPYIATDVKFNKQSEKILEEKKKEDEELLDGESDDDTEILEACINMAMPKSSQKTKKLPQPQTQQVQASSSLQPMRKSSQLPVYKLLPPQSRIQSQQKKDPKHEEPKIQSTQTEEVPRVYCVEGTPLNFSTATSLSDLTIESPPNEEAAPLPSTNQRRRAGLPEGENGDDILAECINAAMPKSKHRKPLPMTKAGAEQSLQTPPLLPPQAMPPFGLQQQKKKPTSPVKPMPHRAPYAVAALKKQPHIQNKPGFAFDSPRHYTPIEGTPCCFSRNDSLSSLDFDEDEDKAKESEEPKPKPPSKPPQQQTTAAIFPQQPAPSHKPNQTDEKLKFAIEDTPVCFSRNSSLSSLSDIDQENNNKEFAAPNAPPAAATAEAAKPAPSAEPKQRPSATHCYVPKAFHVEDTPVCFSRNSSLSSLSIDSEDDLLQECISSAMPKKKKKAAIPVPAITNPPFPVTKPDEREEPEEQEDGGILAEEEPNEAPRSPASPDSESFDWKAIQEGANSIVSSLNAAAAAASSLSRQASSDSDSVLSLKSVGSPFRLPLASKNNDKKEDNEEVESEEVVKKGARILKPGERSTLEIKQEQEEDRSVKGGKKVYRSLITGKPRAEPSIRGRSKPRASIGGKAPGSGNEAEKMGGSSPRDLTPSRKQIPICASSNVAAKAAVKPKTAPGIPRSESASRVGATKKIKSESEKPPALVRQSTFIKEAPSPTLKRKLEESAQAQSEVALDSLSSPESQQPTPINRKYDVSRSHSESPSRQQEAALSRFSRTGTWKRENTGVSNGGSNGKQHSTSLPRVGTWKRTGSSSSVLSASSESSEKGKSEEDLILQRSKGTWRKKKTDSIEQNFSDKSDKSEDVWVRLEDCPVNNPRSSSSCSMRSPTNAPPVIDSLAPSAKIPLSCSSSSSNLNLRRSCESLDEKQTRVQQRSGAVAARVSPFNYTPSSRKSSTEASNSTTTTTNTSTSTTPSRPSLIPTPVTKKREPKGGEGNAGGGSGERGSYIVTSV